MKKPNLAFFTSASRGLAHYVAHLYPDIKKYVNPYYVTYTNQEVDDLAQKVAKTVHQLIDRTSATSVIETIRFLEKNKIGTINLQVSDTVKKAHMQYFAILSYAKYLEIPICLTIHDVFSVESLAIDSSAIEMIYMLGDSFIVGNESEKEKLELFFSKKSNDIVIVPHGPYTMFDNKKWTSESAKKSLGLSGKKIILFFGQIRPNKGLKYLIKALPKVLERHPDAHLYISTDLHMSTPELRDYLNRIEKSGAKNHTTLVKEYIPSSEIERVFKAADVIALPYTQISQSGILNLAFAFKKPVVVSDVFYESGDIDGKMGYGFPSTNVSALAGALSKVLDLPDRGVAMGEKGFKFATSKNSWQSAARLTNKAYNIAQKNVRKK